MNLQWPSAKLLLVPVSLCIFLSSDQSAATESNPRSKDAPTVVQQTESKKVVPQAPDVTSDAKLDFGSASESETKVEVQKEVSKLVPWMIVTVLLTFIGITFIKAKKVSSAENSIDFFSWPLPAKLTVTFLFMAFAATHIFAAITVYLDTRVMFATSREYYFYIKPARLTALSHAHLMAIATMDGIVAILYSFDHRHRDYGLASAVVTMTFSAIMFDIASWWLTKYFGSAFETLSMFTGIFFSVGFSIMSIFVFRSLWFQESSQTKVTS